MPNADQGPTTSESPPLGAPIPPGRKPEFERRLATAFRELEGAICDLRGAAFLMEMAAQDTVHAPEGCLDKSARERLGLELEGYRVHVWTTQQSEGFDYALQHLGDLARALHRVYYAGFGEAAA